MTGLELDPSYLEMLIVKVRALMGKESMVIADPGSNLSDDDAGVFLQETPDDLTREELTEEIEGLSPRKQAELVALMWLGRGDGEAEDWRELLQQAHERRETPTVSYLLDQPLLSDYWAEGLEMLGRRDGVDEVEET